MLLNIPSYSGRARLVPNLLVRMMYIVISNGLVGYKKLAES